jgi:Glyoxalase-like domain
MHRSRLVGFIIDCQRTEPEVAARFWSDALGMTSAGTEGDRYATLDASARDLQIEVQNVDHESRVHLDIESDDVDAEAARLEALGARRIGKVATWWVMEAPTGQRFCVVRTKRDLAKAAGANTWP